MIRDSDKARRAQGNFLALMSLRASQRQRERETAGVHLLGVTIEGCLIYPPCPGSVGKRPAHGKGFSHGAQGQTRPDFDF